MKKTVLLLGAGKIGRMIARLLVDSGDYVVRVADAFDDALARLRERVPSVETQVVDANSVDDLKQVMTGCHAVISALSFRFNANVALAALEAGLSYFDLTEDVATTRAVRAVAERAKPGQVFVPQCGLAPGFVGIVASDLAKWFDSLESVRMRVGALPQFPTNALTYNLTWSTDGLINEYCNACDGIYEGRRMDLLPLEGLEHFALDGVHYEAFNTSGGLGSLCDTFNGQVNELNYKTIRYPGHQALMQFLLRDLHLDRRRELLKDVLEAAIPLTFQDVVIVFCTVTGQRRGQFVQKSDARKIYPQTIGGEIWSAIQITTAAAVCAAMDLLLEESQPRCGFVRQEEIGLDPFLKNRFGKMYSGA